MLTTHKLRPLFSLFPAGRAGAGLLLLRALLGFSAILQGSAGLAYGLHSHIWTWVIGLLTFLCGLLLLAGFLTPIVCALFVIHMTAAISPMILAPTLNLLDKTASALPLIVVAAAVALLGPGALSVDARLFGMREIVISRKHQAPDP